MTTTATAQPAQRLCGTCGNWKPSTEFRRYRKFSPQLRPQCNDCRNSENHLKRQHKRRREFTKSMTAIARARDLNRLFSLLEVLFHRYGGYRGFVAELVHWQRTAPHGSTLQGRIIQATMQMMMLVDEVQREIEEKKARDREEHYWRMSDEELKAEHQRRIRECTKQMIAECPALAVKAAHELGWTVIPPEDGSDDSPDSGD